MTEMICPICKKPLKRGKLSIGWIHPQCLERKKADFVIRESKTSDEMKQIEKLCFDTYGELDFIETIINEKGIWYDVRKMKNYAAFQGKKILGFASWKKEKEHLFLLMTLVAPRYFRAGVGTALLDKIKQIAKKLKVKSILVPISNDDLVSYVFYHVNGFRLSGIDLGLPEKRHGREKEGFWGLPCRDEFFLKYELRP